jgi:aspartokinase-like uncharacterized kinase
LDLPDLAPRVRAWIERQTLACHVLLAGGGAWAETIRRLDPIHHLPADVSHHLALQSMTLSYELMGHLFPKVPRVQQLADLRGSREPSLLLFNAHHFVTREEPLYPGTNLPASWEATSDSIAGRLAVVLGATELVLLKSTLPTGNALTAWYQAGAIDAFLSRLAHELPPVRCVNLRSKNFDEVSLAN